MDEPHLRFENLAITFSDLSNAVVNDVSFEIRRGECVGLVGESGSGKSLTALAAMQLLPNNAKMNQEARITFAKDDLLQLSERRMRRIRGQRIGMIFQDALTALNPVLTIGQQMLEVIAAPRAKDTALSLLSEVGIKDPAHCLQSYPHQLSGGMRQRAMIAMALAGEPECLIADEPTTALDVTIQAQVIALLKRIQQQRQMTLLFISHDLALISHIADRIVVMQHGRIVEQNNTASFFAQPKHPYSKALLAAIPTDHARQSSANTAKPLLQVNHLKVHFPIKKGVFKRTHGYVNAVDGIDFSLAAGQTLALVGESGSGKTTTGLALLSLLQTTAGTIEFDGKPLSSFSERQRCSDIQIVFQDPYAALNPRMLVIDSILEGAIAQGKIKSRRQGGEFVDELLTQVGLDPDMKWRYPHAFSGGQRQRLCIARALALSPKLLILDEPTSALDVSIQRQILDLLEQLQQQRQLAYLLITHNLGVVAHLAHHMMVMTDGKIVEHGDVATVLAQPQHDYTKALLAAVPQIDLAKESS